jgi:hypothetical protein
MPDDDPKPDPAAGSPINAAPAAPVAWQPLTPRGVAAFANAKFGRLLLVQLVVALLGAAAVVWFLAAAWFPEVRAAIRALPDQGQIRARQLSTAHASTEPLAPGRFLAFVLDLDNQSRATPEADLSVEFRRAQWLVCSLFGCAHFDYPKGWTVQFNRPELQSWWGAWEPLLLGGAALLVVLWLFVSWAALATVYAPVVLVWSYFKDRRCGLPGSWRLASAALMPGALFMSAGIVCYGAGALDLIRLLMVFGLHFAVGWVYLFAAPLQLARVAEVPARPKNPFSAGNQDE